ncbi:amidotransferase [Echinicola strongylocentroti]|uniref:Amidotransferase n=1 Tax=Echinicola strongylocentroti TaxID=1795355 RepID=A0A2Z4IQ45_9BACT|nr:type 1 glutamine amidotransferase [Echinicola strongylocentroti]AWW33045.1 amidotransferase [Echinicola strongylocentroti]
MKQLRIHYLQHVHFEGLGLIKNWIGEHQHILTATRFYKNEKLPTIDSFDWLIIMGGPMGVNDEKDYPWLIKEKSYIRKAIDMDKTVIGICLGAQLIASSLGARVYQNPVKEIGWFPVQKSKEAIGNPLVGSLCDTFTVFHWHSETFEIPRGATRLFESSACKNQAFLYGEKIIGLQFHLEISPEAIRNMVSNGKGELAIASANMQKGDSIMAELRHYSNSNQVLNNILNKLHTKKIT